MESQQAFKLQKRYFETLFESASEPVVLLDNRDRIVMFNRKFKDLFGYRLEEAKGAFINDLLTTEEERREAELISKTALEAKPVTVKTRRRHKDGRRIPVELTVRPIVENGELLGIYGVYKDLTAEKRMRRELKMRSEYYRQLFENSPDAILLMGSSGEVMDINKAFTDLFGFDLKDVFGRTVETFLVPGGQGDPVELRATVMDGRVERDETARTSKTGETIEVEAQVQGVIIDGEVVGILANYRDVRQKRRAVEELEEQKVYFKQLFESSPEAIAIIDPEDRVVDINSAFCGLFGYERSETLGRPINDLIAPESLLGEAKALSANVMNGDVVKQETRRKNKSGRMIDVGILAYPVFFRDTQVGGYAIYSDITEKKRYQKEIEFLAYRDSLTGLRNRKYFFDELKSRMQALQDPKKLAVCYIDLNGFKKINDTLGHGVGDELLRYVARNIEDGLEADDLSARMGGDEFLILTTFEKEGAVREKIEAIIEKFDRGLMILNHSINISLSIGVAYYPEHGSTAEEIVKQADLAMYQVKGTRKNGYMVYNNALGARNRCHYDMENRLKTALAKGEMEIHYQPILSMDNRVRGCEALMRWNNAVHGMVSPAVFIPLAEDAGEIGSLSHYLFNRALKKFKDWMPLAGDGFFLSLNLSMRQIEEEEFAETVAGSLQKAEVSGNRIQFELAERNSAETLISRGEVLQALKRQGIALAIDDFGTGCFSLGQMKNLSVDVLKIDRGFVHNIHKRKDSQSIARAIIAIGSCLGLETIAEGVETEAERKTLEDLGCDMYQGYLTLPPVEAEEMEAFLKARAGQ